MYLLIRGCDIKSLVTTKVCSLAAALELISLGILPTFTDILKSCDKQDDQRETDVSPR